MREIEIKNNETGLRVFVNGVPRIEEIGSETLNVIAEALEKRIDEYYKNQKSEKDISDSLS